MREGVWAGDDRRDNITYLLYAQAGVRAGAQVGAGGQVIVAAV